MYLCKITFIVTCHHQWLCFLRHNMHLILVPDPVFVSPSLMSCLVACLKAAASGSDTRGEWRRQELSWRRGQVLSGAPNPLPPDIHDGEVCRGSGWGDLVKAKQELSNKSTPFTFLILLPLSGDGTFAPFPPSEAYTCLKFSLHKKLCQSEKTAIIKFY